MKKIFTSIIAALLVAICCIGCTGNTNTEPTLLTEDDVPWSAFLNFVSETTEYSVTEYRVYSEDEKIAVTDSSESYLRYTVTKSNEGQDNLYTLTTEFRVTYASTSSVPLPDESYVGKTDRITSKSVFRWDTLYAVSTEKEAILETDDNKSYRYKVNYQEGTAHIDYITTGESRDLTFSPNGNYIDNEYLFFYVRAIKDIGSSLSATVNVVDMYECFLNNSFRKSKFRTTAISAAYYSTEGVVINSDKILSGFSDDHKNAEQNSLSCNVIQLALSGTQKTGTPIYAYYTTGSYSTSNLKRAKNLLAQIRTFRNSGAYRTEYTLTDISWK